MVVLSAVMFCIISTLKTEPSQWHQDMLDTANAYPEFLNTMITGNMDTTRKHKHSRLNGSIPHCPGRKKRNGCEVKPR